MDKYNIMHQLKKKKKKWDIYIFTSGGMGKDCMLRFTF